MVTEWSVFLLLVGWWSGLKTMHSGICCVFSLSKAFFFFLIAALCVICGPFIRDGLFFAPSNTGA